MIEVPIPHDILKYKAKFIANFSAREFICLSLSGILYAVLYFILLKSIPGRMYIAAIIIFPILAIGFIRPFGQPFEKIAWNILYDNFICPIKRVYEVRHPEYEKLIKSDIPLDNCVEDNAEMESDATKKKKKQSKKDTKKKKIKKSKEYKGIR